MRKPLVIGAAVVSALAAVTLPAASVGAATSPVPLYNSSVSPSAVGNIASEGPEAYAFNELGNEVTLTPDSAAKHPLNLGKVIVTMSSWACQGGTWHTGDCSTTPGSTFPETVTFNIYSGPYNPSTYEPGALLASVTKSFNFPYRPSANYTHCTGAQTGEWWNSTLHKCFNGKAVNITFGFGTNLPSSDIIFGISYNTSDYGYHPIGQSASCFSTPEGCPYDSLNIGLSQDPTNVTAGADPNPGTVFQYSSNGSEYCDGGAAGTSTFRLDSPTSACWTDSAGGYYVPAVEFLHTT